MAASRLLDRHMRDYTPVSWTEYFDEAFDVCPSSDNSTFRDDGPQAPPTTQPQDDSFRVYLKNFTEPFAPSRPAPGRPINELAASELTQAQIDKYSKVPTLVALHGGGYSGLTWAQFTRQITRQCQCRVLAIDLRAHGDTKVPNESQMDIDTLVNDVFAITHKTHRICGFLDTPRIVLIGHSMGGAIAIKCASRCVEELPSLVGFVVIDVVEGSAKEALPLMMSVIKTRPAKFPSLANAIEWSVRSGMAKNADAARVSMPGNLVSLETNGLAIHDVQTTPEKSIGCSLKRHKFHISVDQLVGQSPPAALLRDASLPPRVKLLRTDAGSECRLPPQPPIRVPINEPMREDEEDETNEDTAEKPAPVASDGEFKGPPKLDSSGYVWRTNLAKTEPYWGGWFEGLSAQLLEAPVQGKFLLLAGIDRLDKTLTIGQMQGKFMMKVLPRCGHAVHEDVPEQVAQAIGDFLVRNKFSEAMA